jgi:sialate O-acetylesterase
MKNVRAHFRSLHLCLAIAGVVPLRLAANIELAPLFRDHAVLQAEQPVPIWGRAGAGETVTATFLDQTATARADQEGRWRVELSALAAGRAGDLVVRTDHESTILHDVMTGEVWLCAGQSNMQMPVRMAEGATEAAASQPSGDIRQFKVSIQTSSTPLENCGGSWIKGSGETVGDFSAVAYYFARSLQARIKRPIGLVVAAKGGSPIESWFSPDVFRSNSSTKTLLRHWDEKLSRLAVARPGKPPFEPAEFSVSAVGPGGYGEPGVLYNGMISPLIPFGVRGILWYQGEANTSQTFSPPDEYGAWFRTLIADFRNQWRQELPFYFVQLPANNMPDRDHTAKTWATVRDGQASALTIPKTGMAVTIDLGEPDSIHPTVKQPVGERLARLALKRTYGFDDVIDSGPVLASVETRNGALRLNFVSAGQKLKTRNQGPLEGFRLVTRDGRLVPVAAHIDGSTIICEVGHVPAHEICYAWEQNPASANLCDASGMPAAPFKVQFAAATTVGMNSN